MDTELERPFLTAAWRYLAMLNYEVEPSILEPLLPAGLELDLWHGKALVSVVGFRFLDTRLLGVTIPGHTNFDEVNLRFYVRRQVADGDWRRGVVFVREIVPRRAIAWVARWLYHEPYVRLPVRHNVSMAEAHSGNAGTVEYRWQLGGKWHSIAVQTNSRPSQFAVGSEEAFITEHYWGYTRISADRTAEYGVAHPPWRVWPAASASLDCDVARLYGEVFAEPLSAPPHSAFVAEGSEIVVYRGRYLDDTGDTGAAA
ncbi:MAG: YqjF family protein [Gemmatimonadales bacterium]